MNLKQILEAIIERKLTDAEAEQIAVIMLLTIHHALEQFSQALEYIFRGEELHKPVVWIAAENHGHVLMLAAKNSLLEYSAWLPEDDPPELFEGDEVWYSDKAPHLEIVKAHSKDITCHGMVE